MFTQKVLPWRTAKAGFISSLLLLVVALTPAVLSAQAGGDGDQSAESITLTPTSKEHSLKAGGSADGTYTVINYGSTAFDIKVYSGPYSVINENYDPLYRGSSNFRDASAWVQYKKDRYRVEPGKKVEVPYTILAPNNAKPGGHYAALFAEALPNPNKQEAVARHKRLGIIMRATVAGDIKKEGQLVEDATSSLQTSSPLRASLRIRNTGNVDFETKVTTRVQNVLGKTVFKSEKDYIIYPSTTRRTLVEWDRAPFIGLFKVEQSADFLDKSNDTSRYVLIMPSWVIIAVIIALIAGVGTIVNKRKSGGKGLNRR